MTNNQPLTLTVEQAAQVLGIGRSTAYELVRTGDLKHIRLRRRVVIPIAHLAERLGVDRQGIWASLLPPSAPESFAPDSAGSARVNGSEGAAVFTADTPTLF